MLNAPVSSKLNDTKTGSNAVQLIANQSERLPISRYALFFLPAILGAVADLWTKSAMFAQHFSPARAHENLPQFVGVWWIEGIFGIQTSTNPGALFGIGKGFSFWFAMFSIVAFIGILLWLFPFKAAFDRWLTLSLGLICGGIFGNFYDRMGWGYIASYPESIRINVRDWILFRLEGVPFFDPWPNFNIADALLVTGAIMLFIHAIFFAVPPEDEIELGDKSSTGDSKPNSVSGI